MEVLFNKDLLLFEVYAPYSFSNAKTNEWTDSLVQILEHECKLWIQILGMP